MNTHLDDYCEGLSHRIDRLVCGELEDDARGQLIAYLEQHPNAWRDVGIAFLEAQYWTESLSRQLDASEHQLSAKTLTSHAAGPTQVSERAQSLWHWIASVAAMGLVAFASGWLWNKRVQDLVSAEVVQQVTPLNVHDGSNELIWATVDSRILALPIAGARVQIPVRVQDGRLLATSTAAQVTEHELNQLRRRGIELRPEQKFISATLPDGRDVAIPLDGYVAMSKSQSID